MGRRGLLAILFRLIRLRCPVPELATRLPSRARSGRRPRRRSRPGCRRVAVQHSGQRAEPTARRGSRRRSRVRRGHSRGRGGGGRRSDARGRNSCLRSLSRSLRLDGGASVGKGSLPADPVHGLAARRCRGLIACAHGRRRLSHLCSLGSLCLRSRRFSQSVARGSPGVALGTARRAAFAARSALGTGCWARFSRRHARGGKGPVLRSSKKNLHTSARGPEECALQQPQASKTEKLVRATQSLEQKKPRACV
jgi:hypothetical protein